MKDDRPSTTAAIVAFARAVGALGLTSAPSYADPATPSLLPPPFAQMYSAIRWASKGVGRPLVVRLLRSGRLDLVPFRTLAINAALEEALASGIDQVVILGAGLDGRAYGLRSLANATVFEVDHPATQRYKQARVASLATTARSLHFVPVNFERQRLAEEIARAGHRAERPTFWIWEGVISYLSLEALRATLADIATTSARGSRLAALYREPGSLSHRAIRREARLFARLGEPMIGMRTRTEMRTEVDRVGLRVMSDTGYDEWIRRFAVRPREGSDATARMLLAEWEGAPAT